MRFYSKRPLSCFAVDSETSRGRLYPTSLSPTRSEYQRDRDRIIHSTAFRRLKHKTQVFIEHEGDHFRTRLTHSIEVGQIARSLSRCLGLDEDLAEALALAHDLGHTPFGHAGEDILSELTTDYGGFDHNAQALRIVTSLEKHYADYDGLNLTWETLEGLVKHNGPLSTRDLKPLGKPALPASILEYNARHDLWLWSHASAEAQCAAIADDIAYNAHDIDDGLRAGLFTLEALKEVPFLRTQLAEIHTLWPLLEPSRTIHELGRRIITKTIEDVVAESEKRLLALRPQHADDIRNAPDPVVSFSAPFITHVYEIKAFLMRTMYRHEKLLRMRKNAQSILADLFKAYSHTPRELPAEWQSARGKNSEDDQILKITDYIAGMTDRFAIQEHRRLFDLTPELR